VKNRSCLSNFKLRHLNCNWLISQSGGTNLMEQQKLILEKILCKLNEQGFAQGKRKKFDLIWLRLLMQI
ncbi:MAG: hypothetical protein LR001_03515, partial [Clostridiales bacterium]|nr:hypothetical protein [Clostridiales bacterium]